MRTMPVTLLSPYCYSSSTLVSKVLEVLIVIFNEDYLVSILEMKQRKGTDILKFTQKPVGTSRKILRSPMYR